MKTVAIIFLLLCAKSNDAQTTSSKVPIMDVKAAQVINEAMNLDTSAIPTAGQLLHLPATLTVVSCMVGIASKGFVVKVEYNQTATGKFPKQVLDIIKKAKPGDELIFEDVYVMKGDRKLKVADKSIVIR